MKKILIVEDNDMNRDMLSRRLERKGYQIETAINGQLGVEAAQSQSPDLILMDINMPVMDGYEATGILKGSDKTSGIPIIALTAYALGADEETALAAGCDAYLPKPVDFKDLMVKLKELLGS